MSSEIHDLSSAELSGLLASRKLSPVERAEDEAAVEAAKFAPVGKRGLFTSCGMFGGQRGRASVSDDDLDVEREQFSC